MEEPATGYFTDEVNKPKAIRWNISTIFYVTAFYAVSFAIHPALVFLTTFVLAIWVYVYQRNKGLRGAASAFSYLIVIVSFVVCLGFVIPGMGNPIYGARRVTCSNSLRQAMLAMLNFESATGKFPCDQGFRSQPSRVYPCSWRVLILPYIEEQALYDAYRFDEPWDSQSNQKLLASIPETYRCPCLENGNSGKQSGLTTYKLVVGEGTLFAKDASLEIKDIVDGTSNQIALVEDHANPIPWTKPEDLTVEEAIKVFADQDLKHVPHWFQDGLIKVVYRGRNVAFFDGSNHTIGPRPDLEQLKCGLQIADGGHFDLMKLQGVDVVKRNYYVLLPYVLYILLVGLPGTKIGKGAGSVRKPFPMFTAENVK